MRLKEFCKRYGWREEDLLGYAESGVLGRSENGEFLFDDGDAERFSEILLFREAGFCRAQIVKFFSPDCNDGCKIRLLRRAREELLDAVHGKQKAIDKIDYILYGLRKGEK